MLLNGATDKENIYVVSNRKVTSFLLVTFLF